MKRAISGLRLRVAGLTAGAGLVALALAGPAMAGCPHPDQLQKAPPAAAEFIRTVYTPGAATPRLMLASEFNSESAPIVGLWEFKMTVGGSLFDWGSVQWHDDGTEITISGGRNPVNGDVCMGAWRQVGRSTFKLSHVAFGYASGAYQGVAHFHETVKVDPAGNSYSGTFELDVFALNPSDPFDESTQVATINGTISAKRVSAD